MILGSDGRLALITEEDQATPEHPSADRTPEPGGKMDAPSATGATSPK